MSRKKPPHCEQCGKFLKRRPVSGLGIGRHCTEHGLMMLEEEPKLSVLLSAYMSVHRERDYLMKKYMGKGRIK